MNDTPLGKIIEIRSETDSEIIKNMTDEQKAVRTEWERFRSENVRYSEEDMKKQAEFIENMMRSMFG